MNFKLPQIQRRTLQIILLLGFFWGVLMFTLYGALLQSIVEKERKSFEQAGLILEEKVSSYVFGLQGMGALVLAHNLHPTREEISSYAKFRFFFRNFTGSMGFGFIRVVSRADLPQYLKQNSLPFKQIGVHQGPHYVIESIEPLEENQSALGLDVASEKFRREAATAAIDSAKPVISAPITLVQAQIKGLGFLYFQPVYENHSPPESLNERRAKIVGFSYTPIVAGILLSHLKEKTSESITYQLKDVTSPEEHLRIFGAELGSNAFSKDLSVGGRIWRLSGKFQDQAEKTQAQILVILAFVLGSGVVIYLSLLWQKSREQQVKVEQKVRSIESWQNAVLRGTSYTMIATDPDGLITIFNTAAEEMTGYTAKEMIGNKTPAILHDPDEVLKRSEDLSKELGFEIPPGFDTFVVKSRLTNLPDKNEWTYLKKNGSRIPIQLSVTTIRDAEGNISGYLGVAEDISELRRLGMKVAEQQEFLVHSAKMSALGEMAGGIAHEINNPLAIIAGQVSIMQYFDKNHELTPENIRVTFDKIHSTVVRIGKIINGLRAFSRDGSKDPPLPTPLRKILDETLDLCRERFQKNGISITVKETPGLNVACRPVEISQVLMNLLLNSFDAVQDQDEKWIDIAITQENRKVFITLTDSGPGIPKDVAQRILEPFFTTKEVGKGTGLGLSISRGIMESHNGTLTYNVHSRHTQFVLMFPCA